MSTELHLNPNLAKALKHLGFSELTPIQKKCIPEIQAGKDVVGQSSTGSGKTAAFGLPILEKIEAGNGLQALILTPTRELCVQVADAISDFGRFMHAKTTSVFGGVSIEPQIEAIKKADIVVGTPGRILDHINRNTIRFDKISFLVLDEADKMFDMGFIEDVEKIISYVPKKRQTLLFSATISPDIHYLIKRHLINPITIKSQTYVDKSLLKQVYYDIAVHEKFSLLVHLIKKNPTGFSLVFCATRRETDIVARNLASQNIHAMAIHGGHEQNKRLKTLDALKKEKIRVLVATDVAARGLDIRNVTHVYNYDVPKSSTDYVHRIGRTARAGSGGDAVTLLTQKDHENFTRVLRDRSLEINKAPKPHFEIVRFSRFQEHRQGSFHGHHERRDGRRKRFSSSYFSGRGRR